MIQDFVVLCRKIDKGIFSTYINLRINVFILALENEFLEIIYIYFRGKQNIFSTIFGNKS